MISYKTESEPRIKWNHADGPLLFYSDGQMHWLTYWERFLCWIGKENAQSIQKKRRSGLDATEQQEVKRGK